MKAFTLVRALAASVIATVSIHAAMAATSTFNPAGLATFDSDIFLVSGNFSQTVSFSGLSAGTYNVSGRVSGDGLTFDSLDLDGHPWSLVDLPFGSGDFVFGSILYTGTEPLLLTVLGEALNPPDQASYSGSLRVTLVPEPGTYALIIAGLGAITFVARRRRPQ